MASRLQDLPELALRLDDGTVIRDSGWRCVADVIGSFHGFDLSDGRVYGVIIYADSGQLYEHHTTDGGAG